MGKATDFPHRARSIIPVTVADALGPGDELALAPAGEEEPHSLRAVVTEPPSLRLLPPVVPPLLSLTDEGLTCSGHAEDGSNGAVLSRGVEDRAAEYRALFVRGGMRALVEQCEEVLAWVNPRCILPEEERYVRTVCRDRFGIFDPDATGQQKFIARARRRWRNSTEQQRAMLLGHE